MLVITMKPPRRNPLAPRRAGTRRQAGFTLIELGVVVSLVAILAAIAVPSFKTFLDNMDAQGAATDLVGDLATARSEALKRRAAVTVSPLDGGWSKGWEMRVAGVAESIRERSALRSGLSISAPDAGVTFISNGRLRDNDADTANVSWTIESSHPGITARCVVITPTGSARVKRGACR